MSFANILVHLDRTDACEARLDVAVALARRHQAKLTGLFALANPHVQNLSSRDRSNLSNVARAQAAVWFQQRTENAGIEVDWQARIATNDARVNQEISRSARYFDLVVLGQFNPATADGSIRADLVEETLLTCGRPVLIVPFAGSFAEVGRRAVIAWNGTFEAVRAINDALPLLVDATRVTILTLDPANRPKRTVEGPVGDMTEHLRSHGIDAVGERLVFDSGAIDAADRLLSHLADEAADLLVMGAFSEENEGTNSRKRLTNRILSHMTTPVLMSH